MTEFEILKECKQAYELLNDLHDNCEMPSDDDFSNIRRCMNSLANIYSDNWYMENDQLETNVKCPRCSNILLVSDIIDYAYLCPDCDENMYYTECEVEKVWWNND